MLSLLPRLTMDHFFMYHNYTCLLLLTLDISYRARNALALDGYLCLIVAVYWRNRPLKLRNNVLHVSTGLWAAWAATLWFALRFGRRLYGLRHTIVLSLLYNDKTCKKHKIDTHQASLTKQGRDGEKSTWRGLHLQHVLKEAWRWLASASLKRIR